MDKKYYQHLKNELSENVEWIITDWILVGCWLLVGWFKWAFDSDPVRPADHHHVGRVRFPPPLLADLGSHHLFQLASSLADSSADACDTVMMAMNESSLKEHPHPYISCNTVFDRMLCKLVGLEFLFLRNFLQGSQYT